MIAWIPLAWSLCANEDLAQDLNCNDVDVFDEPVLDPDAPECAAAGDDVNADWYWDYASYGCAWPVEGLDADGDGLGDGQLSLHPDEEWPDLVVTLACDNCPDLPNLDQVDADCDAVGDPCDNCPFVPNHDQANSDADLRGDACDVCPWDEDPDQFDVDEDGVGDLCDVCPEVADPEQANVDGDAWGDACDPCPPLYDSDLRDADDDGAIGACDNCPEHPNPEQADADGDSVGDRCDVCPGVSDVGQSDADLDGAGDACDACREVADDQYDRDGDGVGDACDVCPREVDPEQADADGDGMGDLCDRCPRWASGETAPDVDADGVPDGCDLCPRQFDPDQEDRDHNGRGDACECDDGAECTHQFRGGAAECGPGGPPLALLWAVAALAALRRRARPLGFVALAGCRVFDRADLAARLDPDGDGVEWPDDCDDRDPDVGGPTLAFRDADGDGRGVAVGGGEKRCLPEDGWASSADDCDDADPLVHPYAWDTCDGRNQDCDEEVDEDVPRLPWRPDGDGDGYGSGQDVVEACRAPDGMVPGWTEDCDDDDPTVHPDALELCDGLDQDCDEEIDETVAQTWYTDADGDGWGTDGALGCGGDGLVLQGGDCADADPAVNPGAPEVCDDGDDDDCDGIVDDPVPWYPDADGDGFGDAERPRWACSAVEGELANGLDCDDTDAAVNPAASEVCVDGIDNDCDGRVDVTWYFADADGDGMGDGATPVRSCGIRTWLADNEWDCDDGDPLEPVVADPVGDWAEGDGTLGLPFHTLQEAVDAGSACVVAMPGTYPEHLDLSSRSVDLWGVGGPEVTRIDPGDPPFDPTLEYAEPALRLAGAGSTPHVRGFTVRGGSGDDDVTRARIRCADPNDVCARHVHELCGGGVFVGGGEPTLSDMVIDGNEASPLGEQWVDREQVLWSGVGGGVCVEGGSLTMTDVVVRDNLSGAGGGIWVGAGATLTATRVQLTDNRANAGAAFYVEGDVALLNGVSWCNRADVQGGTAWVARGATFTARFVTFADVAAYAPAVHSVGTGADLKDAVVDGDHRMELITGGATIAWSAVHNGVGAGGWDGSVTVGEGVADLGPVLVGYTCDADSTNDDLHLDPTSAAVDAADPADGADPDGTLPDLGAWGGPEATW